MMHEFHLTKIFCWVDDNLFVKELDNQTEMLDIVQRSTQLGVMKNEEKFSPFQEEQKFVGFIWNGIARTVQLPPTKLTVRIAQVETFLVEEAKFSYRL
jgi:hypothetical protein